MVWFTIWFMVILKIPIVYLGFVIWWAVKDPPDATGDYDANAIDESDGGGPGWRKRRERMLPSRGPGPHGSRSRRHAWTRRRSRSRASA